MLHKVNLEEAERKLEMVKMGAHQRAKEKLKEAGTVHAKELDELKAFHQEELEQVLGKVDAASDRVKRWEKEKKTIIDSALLLENKAKEVQRVSVF